MQIVKKCFGWILCESKFKLVYLCYILQHAKLDGNGTE